MITERTLKKWRREALLEDKRLSVVPWEGNEDKKIIANLCDKVIRLTLELLDQHLLRKEVR